MRAEHRKSRHGASIGHELPRRVRGMLLIGAAARDAGKTTFACSLIERLARERPVIGAKITVIRESGGCARGGRGCGVCTSLGDAPYLLSEERGQNPTKDTARLLAAGATRVYWLRVAESHLREGRDALLARLGEGQAIVAESNTFRLSVEPDLFLVLRCRGGEYVKDSCRATLPLADCVVWSDGHVFEPRVEALGYHQGRWTISHETTRSSQPVVTTVRMGRDEAFLKVDGVH